MMAVNPDELALPKSTQELIRRVFEKNRHPGLQLDKLSPAAGDMKVQRDTLCKAARCEGDKNLMNLLLDRRRRSLDAVGALQFEMKTCGSLTLHHARTGALDNAGVALHPVYGFIYLPGSGLKGMTRAWAETVWAPQQSDTAAAWKLVHQAFGWTPGSEDHKRGWRPTEAEMPNGSSAGRIVFHDAWPLRWIRAGLDVSSNHHPKYYNGKCAPGDWEDPSPINFLAVGRDEPFGFALSDRNPADDGLLDLAWNWLEAALEFEGVGAKTAAGYGRFERINDRRALAVTPLFARSNIRLAAPAFLAGAQQEKADCDLRPATVRGLLRWWWRTMHAAHVDTATLLELDTVVWGNAKVGGSVRLALESTSAHQPSPHPNKNDQNFLDRHRIARPKRGKVSLGLFYASYGMAERSDFRWFMPAGASWALTLTTRDGQTGVNRKVEASILLEQAQSALWLLGRYGGAGSRSRKGFGSFHDIEIPGIASIESCCEAAARFRAECGVEQVAQRQSFSPALEDAIVMEENTPWKDPWFALNTTGDVLRKFARRLKGAERIPLGLPRRIGRGDDSEDLFAKHGRRHASPAIWSLGTNVNDKLSIRLIAFPSEYLPDRTTSKDILSELAEFAKRELADAIERHRLPGSPPSSQPPNPNASELEKGTFVEAVLLEERTRKGGWKALHEESGKVMPIQNTTDVPVESKVGDKVELYVFSNSDFKWPTPAVKEQVSRSGRSGRLSAGPKQRPGRGRRW